MYILCVYICVNSSQLSLLDRLCPFSISDVMMSAMTSQSPASRWFAQPRFVQAQINENIKAPRHWPLWVEFTGDRWIPLTKGQWRGKCFPFMTSPCMRSIGIFHQIYARLRFASFRSGYLTLLKDRNELFAHAVQGCVSGSGTTVWSPQYQGNNPEEYR